MLREESTSRGVQMGIKQDIEKGIEHGIKTTQIKIAIKMLEEISVIVCLNLNTLRESKKCI